MEIETLTPNEREELIESALQTEGGRMALAASMANPIRMELDYQSIDKPVAVCGNTGLRTGTIAGTSVIDGGQSAAESWNHFDYDSGKGSETIDRNGNIAVDPCIPNGDDDIVRTAQQCAEVGQKTDPLQMESEVMKVTVCGRKLLVVDPLPQGGKNASLISNDQEKIIGYMLETPENPPLLATASENVAGTDNQQERLHTNLQDPQRLHADVPLIMGTRYSPNSAATQRAWQKCPCLSHETYDGATKLALPIYDWNESPSRSKSSLYAGNSRKGHGTPTGVKIRGIGTISRKLTLDDLRVMYEGRDELTYSKEDAKAIREYLHEYFGIKTSLVPQRKTKMYFLYFAKQTLALVKKLLSGSPETTREPSSNNEEDDIVPSSQKCEGAELAQNVFADANTPRQMKDIKVPAVVIGKRGRVPDSLQEGERVTVPLFEVASYPQVRFSQAKARRYNLIDRAENAGLSPVAIPEYKSCYMLEHPVKPSVPEASGDNPGDRDNQQAISMGVRVIDETVECMECGKRLKVLIKHIICKHKMSIEEYKIRHPGTPFESKAVSEKRWNSTKSYIMKTYGVGNWMHVESVKNDAELKMRKTFKERYGVDHPMRSDFVKGRYKKALMDKYGVDCVMRVKTIQEKQRVGYIDTCMSRYGVDNSFSVGSVQKKASMKCGLRKMNRLESQIAKIFSSLKYVGDGSFWVELEDGTRKNPDFILPETAKIVEIFGDYWHGKTKTGMSKNSHVDNVLKLYASAGFECLIIWESEIKRDFDSVAKKINDFTAKSEPQRLNARPRFESEMGEDIVRPAAKSAETRGNYVSIHVI